uniref:Secreted protein n=1 Tax=Meloidogyne incognita TaxID=6306 RepID=A0A914NNJ1_MELIC
MSIFSFGSLLSANVQCGNVVLISGLSFDIILLVFVFAAADEPRHVQRNDSSRFDTITASKMNTTAAKQSCIISSIFTADT